MTEKNKENKVQHVVVKRVAGSNTRVVNSRTYTQQEVREYEEMLTRWRVYATR